VKSRASRDFRLSKLSSKHEEKRRFIATENRTRSALQVQNYEGDEKTDYLVKLYLASQATTPAEEAPDDVTPIHQQNF